MEDLAEELVGEISDEHDDVDDVTAASDGDHAWVMDGDLPIDEAERVIGRALPRGDFETVAGLTIAHCGDLPALNEKVRFELPHTAADLVGDNLQPRRLEIEVVEVERHVPSVLRVSLPPAGTSAPAGDQDVEQHR